MGCFWHCNVLTACFTSSGTELGHLAADTDLGADTEAVTDMEATEAMEATEVDLAGDTDDEIQKLSSGK